MSKQRAECPVNSRKLVESRPWRRKVLKGVQGGLITCRARSGPARPERCPEQLSRILTLYPFQEHNGAAMERVIAGNGKRAGSVLVQPSQKLARLQQQELGTSAPMQLANGNGVVHEDDRIGPRKLIPR